MKKFRNLLAIVVFGIFSIATPVFASPPPPSFTSMSVSSQSGALTSGIAGSATYTVTINRGANGNLDVALSLTTSLPTGAVASFNPATVSFTGNTPASKTSTLTISTTDTTPVGAVSFTVQGVGDTTRTTTGTLTIDAAPTPTATPEPTPTPEPTATPTPEQTPTPTPEVTPTPTPEPEVTPTPTPEPEITPTPTPEPEVTPTPTPEITPTPTPEPEVTPTPTPTPEPEASPTPTPEVTPTPTPEVTPTPTPTSKHRRTSGGHIAFAPGEVLGASTSAYDVTGLGIPGCDAPFIKTYIKFGAANNTDDVMRLQTFLNKELGLNLTVNGFYGPETLEAVKKFQSLHADEILAPWAKLGINKGMHATGYVYKTTLHFINITILDENSCETTLPQPELP